MNINELSNPIKACDILINENGIPLQNIKQNKDIDNKILKSNNGRCYYITVNNIIHKIGYSDSDGGIKSTINAYRTSGNSGRPSDRTHGIHVLIAEQLLYGNIVEIYFNHTPSINSELFLMDGSVLKTEIPISGKILEKYNMEIYKKKYNTYPIQNLQESGKPQPVYIQESRNELVNNGISLTLKKIKERLF